MVLPCSGTVQGAFAIRPMHARGDRIRMLSIVRDWAWMLGSLQMGAVGLACSPSTTERWFQVYGNLKDDKPICQRRQMEVGVLIFTCRGIEKGLGSPFYRHGEEAPLWFSPVSGYSIHCK
jgi:hypothetical protein